MAKSEDRRAAQAGPRGLAKHLEGWQPGLLAVFLAGTVALLSVPASVPPEVLPVPFVDARQLAAIAAADDGAAARAEKTPLDVDVRALGTLLREFGRADASGDEALLAELRSRIGPAAARAQAQGEGALVALRAYQLRSFLREVRRFVATGESSTELIELGGPFPAMLERNGWCLGGPPCAMQMDDAALRASFKRRWNEISGLSSGALALSADEERALYGFLLAHPPAARESGARAEASGARRGGPSYLLRKIDELAAIDPTYPREFARGVVYYRQGEYRRAAHSFAAHLETSPDGPYALRAQNHLRAALERSTDEAP